MTVNTLFKENELGELYEYLLPYYKAGLDGVIVQDLGAVLYSGAFSGNRTSRQHPDDHYQCLRGKGAEASGLLPGSAGQRGILRGDPPDL